MSLQARRELVAAIGLRYKEATKTQKQQILNEFVAASGYHRKYAIGLLSNYSVEPTAGRPQQRRRPRVYTADVQEALVIVWEAANRICSKRLVPFLPELVQALERYGHLDLPLEVKERLLRISPATVDRLLAEVRQAGQPGARTGASRRSLLKQQVPVRTHSEWDGAKPGFIEADLVAHCGGDVSGSYLHTLTMTDVVTGWTECMALLFRDQHQVVQGVCQAQEQLPFPLLALDTDNGSEFLNNSLYDYCDSKSIIFTRSRPYQKNDQCYVEQKNGVIVRQFVGYDRFAGVEPCRVLAELYRYLRLYVNFFQPSLKLLSKERVGSRIIKKYDQAQTPYQRLLAADTASAEVKEQLKAQFLSMDPVQLLSKIQALQDELWSYANVKSLQCPGLNGTATKSQSPSGLISKKQTDEPTVEANGTGTRQNGSGPVNLQAIEVTNERRYRHSKPKRRHYQGQRWWRTRKDPFAEVWPQLQRQLEQRPELSATTLFATLQQQYPEQFDDGQLRTLQRRVRAWRMAYIAGQHEAREQIETPLTVT